MLATLNSYHDRVEALAAEAERLLRREGVAALPRIGKLRTDQGVAMAAYQLFVHRELFEPLAWLYDRCDRDDEFVDPPRRPSRLSRATGPDHSLSVAAELESSGSPVLLRLA